MFPSDFKAAERLLIKLIPGVWKSEFSISLGLHLQSGAISSGESGSFIPEFNHVPTIHPFTVLHPCAICHQAVAHSPYFRLHRTRAKTRPDKKLYTYLDATNCLFIFSCRQLGWFQPYITWTECPVSVSYTGTGILLMNTWNISRKYKGGNAFQFHTLIGGCHSLFGLKDIVYSRLLRTLRLWGSCTSACMAWHIQFSNASLALLALHLRIYVGHSYWRLAFFLSKSIFQVGSMYRVQAYVCQWTFWVTFKLSIGEEEKQVVDNLESSRINIEN